MTNEPHLHDKDGYQVAPSLSVVLNVFKRGANLPFQIEAIERQSWKPDEILIWENGFDKAQDFIPNVKSLCVRSEANLGVWARFLFALNAKTDFIWLLDDDVVPGENWTRNMLDTFESHPGVIGSRGLKFTSTRNYLLYEEYGPNNSRDNIEQVDIVGHNWFFPRDWLRYFAYEMHESFPNSLAGEDFHISYSVQKHLGLGTFVPRHPEADKSLWGELSVQLPHSGVDSNAISKGRGGSKRFENAYQHYLRKGYKPMILKAEEQETLASSAINFAIGKAPTLASSIARLLKIRK